MPMKNQVVNTAVSERRQEWCMGGNPGAIEAQEKRGQQQLVTSDVIPVEMTDITEEDLAVLGFKLGDHVDGDDLFRYAILPDGWSKRGTDHDMWSEIVDASGEVRFRVFYKAAFYDRHATLYPPHRG